ncbi:hypothetical protein LEP1GSC088_3681 [Leptospira interrogans str. L1207]|nr:hypothetical protein LEP1GSC088_3681 [Leptospira interrogans str. L1207]
MKIFALSILVLVVLLVAFLFYMGAFNRVLVQEKMKGLEIIETLGLRLKPFKKNCLKKEFEIVLNIFG